jgi:hypothetical protein
LEVLKPRKTPPALATIRIIMSSITLVLALPSVPLHGDNSEMLIGPLPLLLLAGLQMSSGMSSLTSQLLPQLNVEQDA